MRKPTLKHLFAAGLFAAMTTLAASAHAWPMWDSFKSANIDKSYRVIDYSDERAITTSEGQSYAMFFALVADDRETFDKLLEWTEKNLAKGDITKNLPSWLWGKTNQGWGIIDSNNATDSDLWIAYDLLEAARIWNVPEYAAKAHAMMELLKHDVRDVPNLGKVMLPGGRGFDHPTHVTLNPSYYPVFILRRLGLEDPYWKSVAEGTVRALVRTAPAGFSPDWAKIDKTGKLIAPEGDDYVLGSYNSIRVYLWTGMLSPEDPAYDILSRQFAPMVKLTERMNMPPEKVNVITGAANQAGSPGFGACLLEMLSGSKTADFIRTVIASEPIIGENYYRSVLMLYGAGFDEGLYRFDRDGRLEISQAAQKLTLERAAADARAKKEALAQEQKQKEAKAAEDKSDSHAQAKRAEGESAASESKEAAAAQSAAADQKEPAAEPAPDAAAKGPAGATAPKPEAAAQKPQPAESANGGNAK